ncbi:MAG: hypothetical protein CL498_03305 [Actinobacteria bacterium]|nr:hypothetical protein [Actinomycetota bacterium]
MADTQYVDKDDLKAYIGLTGTAQDNNIDTAIDSACRLIDSICGRKFSQDESVVVKTFTPKSSIYLDTPDISTTTGLIVKLDDNDDGTFETTLTLNTDYIVEPTNPRVIKITGGTTYYEPYNKITILDTRSSERFDPTIKNNIQITAKWGYSAVPEDIKTATLIQALRYFKRKDTPFNTYGDINTGVSELFSRLDPDVQTILKGHKKVTLSGTIL